MQSVHQLGLGAPYHSPVRTDELELLVFLKSNPQLRPYYKWNIHLEVKDGSANQLVHCPLIFESRCGSCVDHGHNCTSTGDSVRCNHCRVYGGRCVYKNRRGSPLKREHVRNDCGRCLLGFSYDRREPYTQDILDHSLYSGKYVNPIKTATYRATKQNWVGTEIRPLDQYPVRLEGRIGPSPLLVLLNRAHPLTPTISTSTSRSCSPVWTPVSSPFDDLDIEGSLTTVLSEAPMMPGFEARPSLYLEILRLYVLNQSAKTLARICLDVDTDSPAATDPTVAIWSSTETNNSPSLKNLRELAIVDYWKERLKRELELLGKAPFWERHGRDDLF